MKYRILGTYHSNVRHFLVDKWLDGHGINNIDFAKWLKYNTGAYIVQGNFEDGWTLQFDDESKYIWFLLKWAA